MSDNFFPEIITNFPASVTLVDGSAEMLEAAKKRLGNHGNFRRNWI